MWGSFYLGSVLNCDCILKYFLGDLANPAQSPQQKKDSATVQEMTIVKEESTISASYIPDVFLDRSYISQSIVVGTLCGFL